MNASESPAPEFGSLSAGRWRGKRTLAGRIAVCALGLACLGLWQSNVGLRQRIAIEKCTGGVRFQEAARKRPAWLAPIAEYIDIADYLPISQPAEDQLLIEEATDDESVVFIEELPSTISALHIRNSHITDATLGKMRRWTRIENLSILNCPNITDDGLRALSSCRFKNVTIVETPITGAGLYSLNFNAIDGLWAEHHVIASASPTDWSNLGSLGWLYVSADRSKSKAAPGWTFLRGCSNLKTFGSDCSIDDEAIADLTRLPRLESLQACGVKDRHFDQLMNSTEFKQLDLAGDFSAANLAKCRCQRLESLELASDNLADSALAGLDSLPSLRSLKINAPRVTGKGLQWIVTHCDLTHLFLRRSAVGDADIELFTRMPNLRFLQLVSTQISRKGYDQLRSALPSIQLIWHDR